MDNNDIHGCSDEIHTLSSNVCDICYEKSESILSLDCCNGSKHICPECISCLTTFICPYCRQKLPENISRNITISNIQRYNANQLSASAPEHNEILSPQQSGWNEFVHNEYLIDPFADYYHNRESRILRRRMRQLRKRYLETHSMNHINNSSDVNRESRRHRRRSLRHYANTITQNLQRNEIHENLFYQPQIENNTMENEDIIFNLEE